MKSDAIIQLQLAMVLAADVSFNFISSTTLKTVVFKSPIISSKSLVNFRMILYDKSFMVLNYF